MQLTDQETDRLRVEFQTEPVGILRTVERAIPGPVRVELDSVMPGPADGRWLVFLTITAPEVNDLAAALADIECLDLVVTERASSIANRFYALTFTSEHEPRLTATLLEHGAIPQRIVVRNHTTSVVVTVTDWESLKTVADRVEKRHHDFELVSATETDGMAFPLSGGVLKYHLEGTLTDDQLTVLETAYQCGYFEVPQQATAEDVAAELDIGQSTLSEHLRTAQSAVWNVLFGTRTR